MAPTSKDPKRFPYSKGALATALDAAARDQLGLADGAEVELRVENGCLIVEPLRPKILAPVSDVAARAARNKQVAEHTERAMRKHSDLLVLLAK